MTPAEMLLAERLATFAAEHGVAGKGALSLVLVVTRAASAKEPPLDPEDFRTPQRGQVAGLSKGAVQAILAEHGISRVLAEEAGRTSRGNMARMEAYVDLLNRLEGDGLLDYGSIESWWVQHVRAYFATKPLKLRADSARGLQAVVADLMEAAAVRQRECPGMMVVGAVMQHLVGAKLGIALPEHEIKHHGFSVADASTGRKGDFLVGDSAIHVTTAPTESLLAKCAANLEDSLRPVVVTTRQGVSGAEVLADVIGIRERIDVIEIGQFVATNIYEWSEFEQSGRSQAIASLIDEYNRIVGEVETDPSLRIAFE